jgi:hypothetical protein
MFSRITSVIVFIVMITWNISAYSNDKQAASRVVLLPFDKTAAGQYSYLADSITTMVAGRVAAAGGVEIVDRALQEAEVKRLRKLAGKQNADNSASVLAADYVVSGGLYAIQAGLQIQATVIPLGNKGTEATFSAVAETEGKILTAVEELCQEIADGIKGSNPQSAARMEKGESQDKGTAGFTTEHPDKNYKKGIYGGGMIVGSDNTETGVKAVCVRRSSPIPAVVVSMAVGDIDGDSIQEIVFASRTAVEIYRFDESRFRKIAEHSFPPNIKIHAVNIADLDGDGKAEIYVSANDRWQASSTIFTWDEKGGFKKILSGIQWYIRPVTRPGEGIWLAGQRASDDAESGYVGTTLVKLQVQQGFTGVSEERVLSLPKSTRLFDFVWADINGDGKVETIAVDQRHKLLVYDQQNNLLWVSTEDYGGSRNFFGPAPSSDKNMANDSSEERTLRFIPARILVQDINHDGKPEIIIGKNKLVSYKWLSNTREYDGGTVACLSWKDSALQELWRTNHTPGYIADYGLVAAGPATDKKTGEGRVQLFVGQVPSRAFLGFMLEKESNILKYDIDVKGI